MKRSLLVRLSLATLAVVAAGCSGGSETASLNNTGGTFLVLKTEPLNNGRLFLNDPISIDFSNEINVNSADLNTVSFQVLDQNGTPLTEQPTGQFRLDRSPGDVSVGRRLLFIPRFPTNDTFDNGGFRPGRTYLVRLVGGDRHNGTVLRDINGRPLNVPVTFQFSTADGTTPAQLFRNRALGGPRRVAMAITPAPENGVSLNKFGSPPVEIRLTFDQPINPSSGNVPVALDTDPLERNINNRGRMFLEYDDPEFGDRTWIPAEVDLEVNDLNSAVVVMRPAGVLPNNAVVRVIVERTFEDISGESNVANAAYNRDFGTFITKLGFEPQFDALVEEFKDADLIDLDAPLVEPFAEVNSGYLKAGFEFEGTRTELEYQPNVPEVVLNTDFTQIVPRNGVPFNVSGGVFNFKNVTIPQGVTVIGLGTRPMVWLCSNDFIVAGTLSVSGGDGTRVDTLNSANYPAAGGVGVCGGGNGGAGSPSGIARDMSGATGLAAGQVPGGGGTGGRIACVSGCLRGSGGGGGSLSTQGDPFYKQLAGAGTSFQQQVGRGGQGCSGASGATTRNLNGGEPGPRVFTDARADNDYWGTGVNIQRQLRISGELAAPVGGQGGGGGGDHSLADGCSATTANFVSDNKGGGGGGGAGVLIVKALRDIKITNTGFIKADGGHGGGGEPVGSCGDAGGGGAGSGGMVILMAGRKIEITVKGSVSQNRFTYGNNDFAFSVSADGGVCKTGTYSAPVVSSKYPAISNTLYDQAPLGALGGMGVVQLMAPPGGNTDGTNTVLDDGIDVLVPSTTGVRAATPLEKKQLLAWRGFPDASGFLVDDFNQPTNIGANEGDIRPAPVLLPVPFSALTRLRSQWIDMGSAVRRPVTPPTGPTTGPRAITEEPGSLSGPTFEFAATQTTGLNAGFASFEQTGGESVRIAYPLTVSPTDILSAAPGAPILGAPTYRVELATAVMGNTVDRFSQFEAELLNVNGTVVGSFRILKHTDRVLELAAEDGALPANAVRLQVRAKFFRVVTNGAEGLGPTYAGSSGGQRVPNANVRIGFAFHQNPADTTGSALRFPTTPGTFTTDLSNPIIRERHCRFVQWDITFDTTFTAVAGDEAVVPAFGPSSPRPELHFLRLPFRF